MQATESSFSDFLCNVLHSPIGRRGGRTPLRDILTAQSMLKEHQEAILNTAKTMNAIIRGAGKVLDKLKSVAENGPDAREVFGCRDEDSEQLGSRISALSGWSGFWIRIIKQLSGPWHGPTVAETFMAYKDVLPPHVLHDNDSNVLLEAMPQFFSAKVNEWLVKHVATIYAKASEDAHAFVEEHARSFRRHSMDEQAYWDFEQSSSEAFLLPALEKGSDHLEDLDDHEALMERYQNETRSPKIMTFLKHVAEHERNAEDVKQFMDAVVVGAGEPEVWMIETILLVEKVRAAAAKFLVEKSKQSCEELFIKPAGPCAPDNPTPLLTFQEKPALCMAMKDFYQRGLELRALRKRFNTFAVLEDPPARATEALNTMDPLLEDAEALFMEKSKIVFAAAKGAAEQLAKVVDGLLVDWKPFTLETEDAAKIKSDLVNNPGHSLLYPTLEALNAAITAGKTMFEDCGRLGEWEAAVGPWDTSLRAGTEQITASAVCVSVYVTRHGTALPATKLKTMRKTKAYAVDPELTLPGGRPIDRELLRRLENAISEVAAEEAALKEKEGKAAPKAKSKAKAKAKSASK